MADKNRAFSRFVLAQHLLSLNAGPPEELALSIAIGTNLSSSARSGYSAAATTPGLAQILDENESGSSGSLSTRISLSEEAKAHRARTSAAAASADIPLSAIAASARTWFDEQYKALGISSAKLDGQVAVDFTDQSRATLSAVASNAQGLFTTDEREAASSALQSRFDGAVSPYVVIARHSGDYAGLYDAALSYMEQAGSDERATSAWKEQRQALVDGVVAARESFGKAPQTGNVNDPVRALLDKPTGSLASGAGSAAIATRARTLLDDQVNNAKDNGKELVFDADRKSGEQADFSQFDNRTLAAVVLNQGSAFSADEVRAAKTELNQRTRLSLLSALNSASEGSMRTGGLAVIKQYANMSDEEKQLLASLISSWTASSGITAAPCPYRTRLAPRAG
jgi:hypothetical protein